MLNVKELENREVYMANYQHILLAVDFSPEARMVTEKGRELAEQEEAKLSIIHVVEYNRSMYPLNMQLPDQMLLDEQLVRHAEVELKELAITHGVANAKRYVALGLAKEEILRVAEEKGVDLIIIGSHGRHGFQLLLGSTANGVIHMAQCDVLAIRVGL